ncbi:ribosome assembly cofactor RimP [Marinirhabdus gelatinilytica]|uniref:Ribosome maturation factor RimP n=1 Tax=Marinirhabdus gelatinilytica TaxID=1703343 RepID=A0A370QKA7_9FLAO|nr:ribosome assembly cofactor RimP [Marinirhabdus gelatinilytica]RDK88759.1 ribosome maturation factor RimP [Marinirhabdus gelatinilytica]
MQKKVEKLLDEALSQKPELFLIDLSISEANQIRVILDGDNGVSVQDCMDVSRAIEHNLDREEQDFSLEVLSAGVSEPLKMVRQYKKNIGRKLQVKTEGETIEGELTEATEDAVTLHWKAREPKPVGKGKVTVQKEATVSYNDIVEAKVMIKFN